MGGEILWLPTLAKSSQLLTTNDNYTELTGEYGNETLTFKEILNLTINSTDNFYNYNSSNLDFDLIITITTAAILGVLILITIIGKFLLIFYLFIKFFKNKSVFLF